MSLVQGAGQFVSSTGGRAECGITTRAGQIVCNGWVGCID